MLLILSTSNAYIHRFSKVGLPELYDIIIPFILIYLWCIFKFIYYSINRLIDDVAYFVYFYNCVNL